MVPKWSNDQTVRSALEITWKRLLCLCEEFIGFVLFLRMLPEWGAAYRHLEDETGATRWVIMPYDKLPPEARRAMEGEMNPPASS